MKTNGVKIGNKHGEMLVYFEADKDEKEQVIYKIFVDDATVKCMNKIGHDITNYIGYATQWLPGKFLFHSDVIVTPENPVSMDAILACTATAFAIFVIPLESN